MEDFRQFSTGLLHAQPMGKVLASVVAEERAHGERIVHYCATLDMNYR